MAVKKRQIEVVSLSFLDCICCGFGAVLLLFVLTIGKHADRRESIVSDIQKLISQVNSNIKIEEQQTGEIRNRLRERDQRLSMEISNRDVTKKNLTDLQEDLALLLRERSSLKDQLDRLLGERKDIPKQEEAAPIPIPNVQRRQYLTGFNFEGNYVVFMIECSGGMVGNTVDEALSKSSLTDEEKRKTVKWRRVVRSVQWIIANLGPKQAYQIVMFNADATALIPEREGDWFAPLDRETTAEVIKHLANFTPRGGANLERAFATVREKFPSTDSIVLLTDGLPTASDSVPVGSMTDDRERERLFRAAIREVPRQTPINVILYPMSGDPAAAFLFWQLADNTHGALISPAESWPDI